MGQGMIWYGDLVRALAAAQTPEQEEAAAKACGAERRNEVQAIWDGRQYNCRDQWYTLDGDSWVLRDGTPAISDEFMELRIRLMGGPRHDVVVR